jgi:putative ABC transport system substrate-binding protein
MNRRDAVLALLALGAAAGPLSICAQQPALPVIGYLASTSPDSYRHLLVAYRLGLEEAGYVEGRNYVIKELSAAGQYDRLSALALEFVNGNVNVIMAGALPSALAAKAATSTIPIVFVLGADPVKLGVVASLGRPSGNLTGVSQLFGALGAKRLELLDEVAPKATWIAVLSNRNNPNAESHLKEIQAAAAVFKKKVQVFNAGTESDIDTVFAKLVQMRAVALLVADDPLFTVQRQQIVTLAAKHRIPTIHYAREFVDAGGLLSYGSSNADNYRLAGTYTGRILKGAKPADLPVLQPTKFELVVNLKVARALGITIPNSVLLRADEVIQ